MQLGTAYAADELARPGAEPLPGFRLIRRIGRGGIGEVWMAEGPGAFPVAMKFVRLSEAGGEAEARAIEISRSVRHPNLVVSFGAWVVGDTLAIGMELADRTLWDRFREATGQGLPGIPRDELLGYLTGAARGIDFLNEGRHCIDGRAAVGVQHRDIKPQNLLLFGSDVKVADFGLARLLSLGLSTRTGNGSWTFAYAAPELFRNQAAQQSDQYSLAITYCQLRGGRVPFAGTAEEVMAGHLLNAPDLSMLPRSERPIVARALAKQPAERWPSCASFVEALQSATLTAARKRASRAAAASAPSRQRTPANGNHATAPSASPPMLPQVRRSAADEASPAPEAEASADSAPAPGKPPRARSRVRTAAITLAVLCPLAVVIGGLDALIQSLRGTAQGSPPRPHPTAVEASATEPAAPQTAELSDIVPAPVPPAPAPAPEATALIPPASEPPELPAAKKAPDPPSAGTGTDPELAVTAPEPDRSMPLWPLRLRAQKSEPPRLEGPLDMASAPKSAAHKPTARPKAGAARPAPSGPFAAGSHAATEPAEPAEPPRARPGAASKSEVAHRTEDRPRAVIEPPPARVARAETERHAATAVARNDTVGPRGEKLPDPIDDAPLPPPAPPATQSPVAPEAPPPLMFLPGRTAGLPVTIQRQGLDGPVNVSFEGAPAGMTMRPVTIPPGAERADAEVTVAPDAEPAEAEVTVVATSAGGIAKTRVKVAVQPDPALARLREGKAELEKQEYGKAILSFSAVIQADPQNALAYTNRATAYHKQGDYNRAIADYSVAIGLKPDDPVTFNNRGLAFREMGLFYKAIADYTEALRLKPGDAMVHYNRGLARSYVGDTIGAITDFNEAIRLRPDYAEAYRHRAEAYTRRGDEPHAHADLTTAARIDTEQRTRKPAVTKTSDPPR